MQVLPVHVNTSSVSTSSGEDTENARCSSDHCDKQVQTFRVTLTQSPADTISLDTCCNSQIFDRNSGTSISNLTLTEDCIDEVSSQIGFDLSLGSNEKATASVSSGVSPSRRCSIIIASTSDTFQNDNKTKTLICQQKELL